MKTKPINSKESINILENLMIGMGYNQKEIKRFIKNNKIGKEKYIYESKFKNL